MTTITRIFGFDAGHRILGHESKCANLHGHRYTAEVTVTAPELDGLGRVIDFSKIKELVGDWIDEHWDHSMILNSGDPLMNLVRETFEKGDYSPESWGNIKEKIFGPKPPYLMPDNPTAENMAKWLFGQSVRLLSPLGMEMVRVKLWETPNCFAVYTEEKQ